MLVAYLLLGSYTREVHVSGKLTPTTGAIQIVAPQLGRILVRNVHEGETVASGQVLYELREERINRDGDLNQRIDTSYVARKDLMQQENLIQEKQLQQRQHSLRAKQELCEDEIARLDEETKLQDSRVLSAKNMTARYATLRQQGFVSELQFSQIENDYNEQLAHRQTLERAKLTSRRELLQVQEDAQEIDEQIRLNAAQTESNVTSLSQEADEHRGRSQLQVVAPMAGTVTTLTTEPGQSVSAGATLATILPTGSALEAHLLVPSRAMGFIEPGQQVRLRLTAFPYQKFGAIKGVVVRVEGSPIGEATEGSAPASNSASEPVYRVIAKLPQQSVMAYGKKQQLRTGMTLEADIHQDRRRLIEWIIDPILSAAINRHS